MDKIKRASIIINTLNLIYPKVEITLDYRDAYTLLVAVVLSAQCMDKRVNIITPKLFALANNPLDMIKLGQQKIFEIIRPCGLAPMKSKGIYTFSKIIMQQYGGAVPKTFKDLESLPAVGHKTASVMMMFFGFKAFPVDTHIHRLATRWHLTSGKSRVQTEKDLKTIFSEDLWYKLHLQMIKYGREYCKARDINHDKICQICQLLNQ